MLSAKEAAAAVGMTKAGIIRSIHTGKISAAKDALGQWRIQPVELFRVYTPVNGNGAGVYSSIAESIQPDIARYQAENDALRLRLADKEETLRAKDDLIDALKGEVARLTAVVGQLQPPKAKAGWWTHFLE